MAEIFIPLLSAIIPVLATKFIAGVALSTILGTILGGVALAALASLLTPNQGRRNAGLRVSSVIVGGSDAQFFPVGVVGTKGARAFPVLSHGGSPTIAYVDQRRPDFFPNPDAPGGGNVVRDTRTLVDSVDDLLPGTVDYSTSPVEGYVAESFGGQFNYQKTNFLTHVTVLSHKPGIRVNRVAVDDEWSEIDRERAEHPKFGLNLRGKYVNRVWIKIFDGTQTTAWRELIGWFAGHPFYPWDHTMIGHGIAYVVMTFEANSEIFTSSPDPIYEVQGIPLYDIRKDSTQGGVGDHRWGDESTYDYTENPIVIAHNLALGIPLPGDYTYGGDWAFDKIPKDQLIAAMDEADMDVDLEGGNTEPQYRCGMELALDEEPRIALDEILKSCSGAVAYSRGNLLFRAGPPTAPVMSLTSDLELVTEESSSTPFPEAGKLYNGLRLRYSEPANLWAEKEAPVEFSTEYLEEDRNWVSVADVSLSAVFSVNQACRLASAWLKDNRRARKHIIKFPLDTLALDPLDTIMYTDPNFGYVGKLFEIGQIEDDHITNIRSMHIREVDPADYMPPVLPEIPAPAPVDPDNIPVLVETYVFTDWTVAPLQIVDQAGTPKRPGVIITINDDVPLDITSIEWQMRLSVEGDVVLSGTRDSLSDFVLQITEGVLPGTAYYVRIRPLSRDRRTDWTDFELVTTPNVRPVLSDIDSVVSGAVENAQTAVDTVTSAVNSARVAVDLFNNPDASGMPLPDLSTSLTDAFEQARDDVNAVTLSIANLSTTFNISRNVITHPYLDTETWDRLSSGGTLSQGPNEEFVQGTTWHFTTAMNEQDGMGLHSDQPNDWPGQENADGYVAEVDFTLVSGVLDGAIMQLAWINDVPVSYRAGISLNNSTSGDVPLGRRTTAVALLRRPTNFAGTFSHHFFGLYTNNPSASAGPATKEIKFHRVFLRAATEEELTSGLIASELFDVSASLVEEALARTQADNALAGQITTLNSNIATVAENSAGWQLILDDVSVGDVRDSVTASTGGEALGQSGTVIITEDSSVPRNTSGRTNGYTLTVPTAQALQFASRRVRISVLARRPQNNSAIRFGVAYSTSDTGNSGYLQATRNMSSAWEWFTFYWNVTPPNIGMQDYIGIYGDDARSGRSTEVARVLVESITEASELPEIANIASNLSTNYNTSATTNAAIAAASTSLGSRINAVESDLSNNYSTSVTTTSAISAVDMNLGSRIDGVESNLSTNYNTSATTTAAIADATARLASTFNKVSGVIEQPFLNTTSWSRAFSQGTLVQVENEEFSQGLTWNFTVTANQNDRLFLNSSESTDWSGQENADGYVAEVDFTLVSGSLTAASIQLSWINDMDVSTAVRRGLLNAVSGEVVPGTLTTAIALFKRPASFTGSFDRHIFSLIANNPNEPGGGGAKNIKFHRAFLRVATNEELVTGEIESNLANVTAEVTRFAEVATDVNDFSLAHVGLAATVQDNAGEEQVAELRLTSWNDPDGSDGSLIELNAQNVVAEGTLGAEKLVIGLGKNLVKNADGFQGLRYWGGPFGASGVLAETTFSLRPPGVNYTGRSFPTFRLFQRGAASVGHANVNTILSNADGSTSSLAIPVKPGDYYIGSAYVAAVRCTGAIIIIWRDRNDNITGLPQRAIPVGIVSPTTNPDEWPRYHIKAQAPANTAFAQLVIRKFRTILPASDSSVYFHKPMFEFSHEFAGGPSPWASGGTTLIDGGSGIFENTITASRLVAGTITADSGIIADLAVNTLQIAEQAVTTPVRVTHNNKIAILPGSSVGGGGAWTDTVSLTMERTGIQVELIASLDLYVEAHSAPNIEEPPIELRIRRGNQSVGQEAKVNFITQNNQYYLPITFARFDSTAFTGMHTYTLQIRIGETRPGGPIQHGTAEVRVVNLHAIQYKR